ncbi:uncharacterized protein LOC100374279 isoform X2 [Saccoglossus kowalevskii]
MASVPNACFAATNIYANYHKHKVISDIEETPPPSPPRPRSPASTPSKWLNTAFGYFQGRPRSSSQPDNYKTDQPTNSKPSPRSVILATHPYLSAGPASNIIGFIASSE